MKKIDLEHPVITQILATGYPAALREPKLREEYGSRKEAAA